MIRAALIRLLWRSVADQDECDGRCEEDGSPLDICDAVRALGYGDHFNVELFQQRALNERRPCERCRKITNRVRCSRCCRDLCERCLAQPTCAHASNGVHQERAA